MESKQRINKRFLFLTSLIVLIVGNLFSQPPQRGGMQGPPPLPDSTQIVKMIDELAKEISLTDKQKTKVSELYFAHFEEAGELQEKYKADRESQREAMDELREDFDDQQKEFEVYIKNRQKQQPGNRPGRR